MLPFPSWSNIGSALVAGLVLCSCLAAVAEPVLEAPRSMPQEQISITKEMYAGWPNTYRLANGLIAVRVVTDVGPRVMDVRLTGGENLFYVRQSEAGKSGEAQWMFRGGWRLWIAPEKTETTYVLDNAPSNAEIVGSALRVSGPPQPAAGIQKHIEVSLRPGEPCVRVSSRIKNIGDRPVTYAAWSLPVMRPGGRAFVPLDVGSLTAFDAIRRLILWSYTEIGDPRYRIGNRLIEIDHRRVAAPPPGQSGRRDDESKIGVDSAQGWTAYLLDGTLFLKRFPHDQQGNYPDGGSTIEVYSSHEFLELEHLGPLTTIAPGEAIVFAEDWWLLADVTVPAREEAALATLQSYVERASVKGP